MLLVGMAAWVARYGCSRPATQDRGVDDFLGVLLHGICYDFFFVTGMIYVDKRATQEIRNQAQGFSDACDAGPGPGHGCETVLRLGQSMNTKDGVADWYNIWLIRHCLPPA